MVLFAETWSLEWWMQLMELISIAFGIVGGVTGVIFGIVNFVKRMKGENASTIFAALCKTADDAMKAAEKSGLNGADKKTMVMDAVQAACKDMNVEFSDELKKQISDFIDKSVNWFNGMIK